MQRGDDARAERRWSRSRVPNLVFSWGPIATVVLYVLLSWSEPVTYVATIDELVSWSVMTDEVLFGILAVLCVMGWLVPRVAAVALIVSISPLADPVANPVARNLWILWCGILALDWILRASQRSMVAATGDRPAPDLARLVRGRASDLFVLERRVATGVLLVAVLATSWFWVERRHDLIELDRRAQPAVGTVTDLDTLDDVVTVRVAGATHEFWVGDASLLRIGQTVPVLVDPTGQERPYGLGDADPDSWSALLVLIGVLATLATLTAGYGPVQRRRLGAALGLGEPGRPGVVQDDDGALLVWMAGAEPQQDPPSALLPAATPVIDVPPDALEPEADGEDFDAWDELEDWEELASPEPATIYGLGCDGGPTVVVLADGSAYISLRAARDPWTTTMLVRVAKERLEVMLGGSSRPAARSLVPADHPVDDTARTGASDLSLVRHVLPFAPWALGPALVLVHLFVHWFSSGPDGEPLGWFLIGTSAVGVGSLLTSALASARFPLRRHSTDLVVRGVPFDRVVATGSLLSVEIRPEGVVLERADDGEEPIHILDRPRWGRLDEIAIVATEALNQTSGRSRARDRRRPSVLLLVTPTTFAVIASATWRATDGSIPWW